MNGYGGVVVWLWFVNSVFQCKLRSSCLLFTHGKISAFCLQEPPSLDVYNAPDVDVCERWLSIFSSFFFLMVPPNDDNDNDELSDHWSRSGCLLWTASESSTPPAGSGTQQPSQVGREAQRIHGRRENETLRPMSLSYALRALLPSNARRSCFLSHHATFLYLVYHPITFFRNPFSTVCVFSPPRCLAWPPEKQTRERCTLSDREVLTASGAAPVGSRKPGTSQSE